MTSRAKIEREDRSGPAIQWSCALLFVCLLMPGVAPGVAAAAEVRTMTIQEFLEHQPQWTDWVGEPLRLEGRYSSFTKIAMQFQRCPLYFYLPETVRRPVGRNNRLEVTGVLQQETSGLSFQVETLKMLMPEAGLYHLEKQLLPGDDAEKWYDLGQRTRKRGEFYQDETLKKLARETLAEGLFIEKSQLTAPTVENLRQLSEKAVELELSPRERQGYLHDYLRAVWEEALQQPKPDFPQIKRQIADHLPGSGIELPALQHVQYQDYQENPVAVYRQAQDPLRRQLSRVFYLQVLREEFQRRLLASRGLGDKLAEEYLTLAPEDAQTAEEFRQQALLFRTQNISTARRGEVLALAEEYRRKQQPELALAALKTWLDHRVAELHNGGPADYRQIALDYIDWLNHRASAETVLLSGIRKYPEDAALQSQLLRLGFVVRSGVWLRESDLPKRSTDKLEEAIRVGRIITGMKPEHVLSTLGTPGSVTQIVSADEIQQIWNYPETQLAIRFQKRVHQKEFTVTSIDSLHR